MIHNWFLAYLWWLVWGFGRWLRYANGGEWNSPIWYWGSDRRTSWRPVRCTCCGWRGPERWARHCYANAIDPDDVVQSSHCPRCYTEVW